MDNSAGSSLLIEATRRPPVGVRRLLHVCGNMRGGGIRSFVVSVAALNEACDTVHDVLLIYDDKGDVDGGVVGCTVHRLGYPDGEMLGSMRRFAALAQGYDAVLIHAAHPVVVLPLIRRRIPCLLFQHGMAVSSGPWPVRLLKRCWYTALPPLLGARVVCSTAYAFEKMRALGIRIPRSRVDIFPFGIRMERQAPPVAVDGVIRIGMAGNLVSQKRQDLVVESLQAYAGTHRIHLAIAGQGPEQAHLEALAARIESDRVRVEFAGYVTDMEAFSDGLDLFVFPSRGESFGLVVVEAMSRGVPVAVFEDVGGCLSLIEDRVNGFVMAPGVEGLAALWRQLDRHPALLEAQKQHIAQMDLDAYDIRRTRHALEELANTLA